MRDNTYDPKKLLDVLIDVEGQLGRALENYCPHTSFTADINLDQLLEDFLHRQDVKGNEVGFLSTQIALLGLLHEIEKTKGVLVETNNLRAWEDFLKSKRKGHRKEVGKRRSREAVDKRSGMLLWITVTILIIVICGLWLFSVMKI